MQEFIQQVTKSLGIPEGTTRSATGGMLQLIQKQADGNDFQSLLQKLPGASDLLSEGSDKGGGGGLLGGLAKQASSLIGGSGGGALSGPSGSPGCERRESGSECSRTR